jgi:hypothetical protein
VLGALCRDGDQHVASCRSRRGWLPRQAKLPLRIDALILERLRHLSRIELEEPVVFEGEVVRDQPGSRDRKTRECIATPTTAELPEAASVARMPWTVG